MPQMRQLPDGTWLNEETGVVVAPEVFAYAAGQNDVYTGPPLMPPDFTNPSAPLPSARGGVLPPAPSSTGPGTFAPMPGPHLAMNPFQLGAVTESVKKIGVVVLLLGVLYTTVRVKSWVNGKKKS